MLRTAALAMLALLLAAAPDSAAAQADLVLHNARIYTVDAEHPEAEALAVRGGRILMVGGSEAVLAAYPEAERLDAEGRTVVPGLIDAHAHLMEQGLSMLEADLVGTASKEEIVERLKAFVEEQDLPEGAWLTGRGWDQNDWPEKEFPTRADLDAAFPDRPVWITRVDGHAAWANTAALEAAGLEALRADDDPEGGRILRDAEGEPTGVLIDAAMPLVGQQQPAPAAEARRQALQLVLEETATYGLTGVHDAGIDTATVALYKEAVDAGTFDLRLYGMIGGRGETFDQFCADGPLLDYGGKLTVRAVKFYMDGALGSRGAALLADYADDPGNNGLLNREPAAFEEDVQRALECGFQVNTHAIGDRANRVVLDAYEAAMQQTGRTAGRHRVEHAQILAPDDLPRFAELSVIASMQPTHATSDMPWAEDRLGPERIQGAYAWQALADSGARLAFGSDFPVEQVDPLLGFYAAITRQDAEEQPEGGWQPAQRVSREAALRGFTLDAAYAAFQEDEVGSLEPGKRADFVILSKDIMQMPPADILNTEVVATYLGGQKIYGR